MSYTAEWLEKVMPLIAKLAAIMVLALCVGCASAGGMDGQIVGGCTMHQANSALAGVAWADCPADGHSYVTGSSEGYVEAVAPFVGSAMNAGIIYGAGALLPQQTTNVTIAAPSAGH
jgi:hypothetical protein